MIVASATHLHSTTAWGQAERPPAVVTEIWMVGEDLALTRRIPQDHQSALHSYEEVARSMVNIAESRFQDRDEQTAEWLHQWAQVLTDGRIGSSPRTARRDHQPDHLPVPAMTQTEPPQDESLAPSIPDFAPDGLAIEWPISAFNNQPTPDVTQNIDYESELLHNRQSPDDRPALVPELEPKSSPAATSVHSSAPPSSLPELAVNQREEPMDVAGRQVALLPAHVNQGFADPRPPAVPAALTERTTLLALSCFAAGVVCCFVLHALLLLTPVRLTVSRPTESPVRTLDHSPAQASRARETVEPARRESSLNSAEPPVRDIAPAQDKASSIIEDFYSSNLELFAKLAQPTH